MDELPPEESAIVMGSRRRVLESATSSSVVTAACSDDGRERSPLEPTPDELKRLRGSRWHGCLEFEFEGDHVHPGVYDAVSRALGKRAHFSHGVERTVFVTMAIEGPSASEQARLHRIADFLASLLPNATLTLVEIDKSDEPEPNGPIRNLSVVNPEEK